jgi:predicted acylesterase/phospholipase RssA
MEQQVNPLVLSGAGGGIGFISGALDALIAQGNKYDHLTGVSSGAIVGIMYATRQMDKLKEILWHIEDRQVVRKRPLRFALSALTGGKMGYYDNAPLRRLLRANMLGKETSIPFVCVAVNAKTGKEIWWQIPKNTYFCIDTVDVWVSFILSSTAIPVAFSPVKISGDYYTDGGSSTHTPIRPTRSLVPSAQHMTIISSALQERNETGVGTIELAGGMLGDLVSSIAERDFLEFEYKNALAQLGDSRYTYIPATIIRPKQPLSPTTRFNWRYTRVDYRHGVSVAESKGEG